MGNKVLKYQFDAYMPRVKLPKRCRIIHLAHQPGTDEATVTIWCKVYGDPEPVVETDFEVYGTGKDMEDEYPAGRTTAGSFLKHIGTAVSPNYVFHVFTRRRLLPTSGRRGF